MASVLRYYTAAALVGALARCACFEGLVLDKSPDEWHSMKPMAILFRPSLVTKSFSETVLRFPSRLLKLQSHTGKDRSPNFLQPLKTFVQQLVVRSRRKVLLKSAKGCHWSAGRRLGVIDFGAVAGGFCSCLENLMRANWSVERFSGLKLSGDRSRTGCRPIISDEQLH